MTPIEYQACQIIYMEKRRRPFEILEPHQKAMFFNLCRNTNYGDFKELCAELTEKPKGRTVILDTTIN